MFGFVRGPWFKASAAAWVAIILIGSSAVAAEKTDLSRDLAALRAVEALGKGNRAASDAWQRLARVEVSRLPELLAGLDGANPIAANYLRSAIEAVAERQLSGGGKLPEKKLESFALERRHSPQGRRLAFEWLAKVDATATNRLIPKMLDDPSLEMRRDAVARVIAAAEKANAGGDKASAIASFKQALSAARDVDQVKACADPLRKLGEHVDLPKHFGFVMTWQLIGPFDNTEQKGFNVAYPPESQYKLDAEYDGKLGKVRWKSFTTTDDYGSVDLNKALLKHKGAVVYAAAEFTADELIAEGARDVELRCGTINAVKLWLNGKPVLSHEVYHTAVQVDQFAVKATLKPGKNLILLKVCQNEQTEDWAQQWLYQLRVCDTIGTAVLSK